MRLSSVRLLVAAFSLRPPISFLRSLPFLVEAVTVQSVQAQPSTIIYRLHGTCQAALNWVIYRDMFLQDITVKYRIFVKY